MIIGKMELNLQFMVLCFVISLPAVCSNPGKEFLLAFPQNHNSNADIEILITSVVDTSLTVNLNFNAPADFIEPSAVEFTVAPKERYPVRVSYTLIMSVGNLKDNKSMTIHSTDNILVQIFNKQNSNGDAYLALPVEELGTEFYTVNYDVLYASITASYIVVVAAEDNTTVMIRLPKMQSDIELEFEGRYYGSSEMMKIQLSAKEVFQLQLLADLTGSRIKSDRPIFVISGQNRTRVLYSTCRSYTMDVVPSLGSTSTDYVTVSFPDIGAFYRDDVYRIIATSVNTTVTIGGAVTFTLDREGDFYEHYVGAFEFSFVKASKPIYVAQLSSTPFNSTDRFGDASMMILTPLPAQRSSYIFSAMKYNVHRAFLTIVIEETSSSALEFDGDSFTTQWYPVTGKPSFVVGMLEINQTVVKSHRIHHPGGVMFLAYLQAGEYCEAYALPLSYYSASKPKPCEAPSPSPGDGLDNNCNGEVDEEICCVGNEDSGIIYYNDIKNRDCLAPVGYTASDVICCGENSQPFICRGTSVTSLSTSVKRRKFSTVTNRIFTKNKASCNMNCLTQPMCSGINFNANNAESDANCELLLGEPSGSADDLNWVYYAMRKEQQYS